MFQAGKRAVTVLRNQRASARITYDFRHETAQSLPSRVTFRSVLSVWGRVAWRTRARKSGKPARPYMARLNVFSLLI